MADTKIRVPLATDSLKDDHDRLKKLFIDYDGIEDGEDNEKYRVFSLIQRELTIHAAIEDEIFYPAIAGAKGGAEVVSKARGDHETVKELLGEIGELSPEDEAFGAKMSELRDNVDSHAADEEASMFPLFGGLDEDEREKISEALWEREQDLRQEGRLE